MEFENLIAKIIMKYMDDNKIEEFSYEDAWQLAKKIELVAKPKSRSQARSDFAMRD